MDKQLRVLIVEDSDRDVAMEVRALEAAGYRVTYAVAETAGEMKAALTEQAFDIVIADHDLPQFDAPGALAVLKQTGLDIPFIIVSGIIGEETAVALMKAGAHDYVMKDRLSRLVPAVQKELTEAESRRESKQVAEALRESEGRFNQLAEQGGIIAWEVDAQGLYTYVSHPSEAILGYHPDELVGRMHFYDLHPETGREAFKKAAFAVFDRKKLFRNLENAAQTKDGRHVWLSTNGIPLLHTDGILRGYRGSNTDITDRKRAEDKLRITQFAVDCAAEPIGWVGKDGRHLYVNDAYCRLLDYSKDEFLTLKFYDLDPEVSAKSWLDYWEKIKQKDLSVLETSLRSKNGVHIPLEIHTNYLLHGDEEFVVTFCRDIRERKLYEEHLKLQIDRLAALRAIDMAITASLDIRVTFSVFLEQVIACLGVDAADVLLIDSLAHNRLSFVAGRGFRTSALRHTNLKLGAGYAGMIAQERKTILILDIEKEEQDLFKNSPQLGKEDFVSYCGTPLIAKGQVRGVLEIFNRTPIEPDQEWLDFMEALATQAAIAIDNAMLFDDLQKSNIDLLQAYDNTLEGWSNALDLRDKETEGHSQRVTDITLRLAGKMGMRDSEQVHARRGALLHDIGKMGIPDQILLKPSALNDAEWEIMRKHPVYAYELLYPISHLRPALDIPYCHHEKWDGTGYPRGLKGEYIPLSARIFSIVDVWDALCSDRPYRPGWPEEKVREYISEQAGKHFDPKVVDVFLELMSELKPE